MIRSGSPQAVLVPNKVRTRYRPSRELSDTLKSLSIPLIGGVHLNRAFADAAEQRTLVWQLGPRAGRAVKEITALLGALDLHGSQTGS
jgi:hypothetical protein